MMQVKNHNIFCFYSNGSLWINFSYIVVDFFSWQICALSYLPRKPLFQGKYLKMCPSWKQIIFIFNFSFQKKSYAFWLHAFMKFAFQLHRLAIDRLKMKLKKDMYDNVSVTFLMHYPPLSLTSFGNHWHINIANIVHSYTLFLARHINGCCFHFVSNTSSSQSDKTTENVCCFYVIYLVCYHFCYNIWPLKNYLQWVY